MYSYVEYMYLAESLVIGAGIHGNLCVVVYQWYLI